jgi:hypothetical protein
MQKQSNELISNACIGVEGSDNKKALEEIHSIGSKFNYNWIEAISNLKLLNS